MKRPPPPSPVLVGSSTVAWRWVSASKEYGWWEPSVDGQPVPADVQSNAAELDDAATALRLMVYWTTPSAWWASHSTRYDEYMDASLDAHALDNLAARNDRLRASDPEKLAPDAETALHRWAVAAAIRAAQLEEGADAIVQARPPANLASGAMEALRPPVRQLALFMDG